ncbi:carboxypeptidase [Fructilactobacillus sanfranciscensis]|uniref:transglycosylase domain-containing protein n=1 Tax=Fructilactobacillus sanfranciscensis TaxID=1625 RepID=UPI000CD44F9D|nr:PBP1A family penicillin-binding protein [Fructilactobacillus sanfranciscensis]POH09447.1 carboxypeptidase [Fructilactobacillus sanfranciscensis]POH10275.1 carboxypeptidase [Fructilactobacillus sanfranciscensis]
MSSDEIYSRIKKNKRHMGPIGHIVLWIIFFIFVLFLMGCGMFTYYAATSPHISYSTLSSDNSTTIYDKDGRVISRLGMQNRDYVKSRDIPENLKNAIISVEDRHFYTDKGIDPIRIMEAAVSNIFGGGGLQGGSTLTQQLVKLSVFSTKSSDQTLKRKAQEAWLAIQVDRNYSKQQILEFYINKVYMGNNSYGMQTASDVMFNKPLSELDLSQTALLAGLPQAPVSYNPVTNPEYARDRRNQVLDAMVKNKAISKAQAESAKKEYIEKGINKKRAESNPTQANEKYADGYISQVIQELQQKGYKLDAGNKVYTNLDMDMQKHMYKLANDSDNGLGFPNNDFQIGATVVDPNNGKVVAMLGGRKQNTLFGFNRAVQTARSSGSTIKPLMDYGPAVEYLNYPTYETVKDTPYTYPGTNIKVENFDNKFDGNMTMQKALVESRNVPALRTLSAVGIGRATDFLSGLGMTFKKPLTLQNGLGAYVSTEQEAAAFSAFSNGGTYYKPYTIDKVVTPTGDIENFSTKSNQAMSASTAFIMTQMLKGVINNSDGSATSARISGLNQAGKSGQTQYPSEWISKVPYNSDMDAWFTGYTKHYSMSVWTGYDQPFQEGHEITGRQYTIAQNYYKAVMSTASEGLPNTDWSKPSDVVKTYKDGHDQYYIAGHGENQNSKPSSSTSGTQNQQVNNNQSVTNNSQNQNNQQNNGNDSNNNHTNNGTNAPTEQTPNNSNNNQSNNNPQNTTNNNADSNNTSNTQTQPDNKLTTASDNTNSSH